eukprot:Colp12_sorted_trinity150504_noHs@26553
MATKTLNIYRSEAIFDVYVKVDLSVKKAAAAVTMYEIDQDLCYETDVPSEYIPIFNIGAPGFQAGKCEDNGYSKLSGSETQDWSAMGIGILTVKTYKQA